MRLTRREAMFSGTEEFNRLEGEALPSLRVELETTLAALERLVRGRTGARVRLLLDEMRPLLVILGAAPMETLLDPEVPCRTRAFFEAHLRAGTRTEGAVRIAVEKATVVLRILELRVVAIRTSLGPEGVGEYRKRLVEDLWCEPLAAGSATARDLDWRTLPPEMRRAWLERLLHEWRWLNWYYLQEALRPPLFELIDSRQQLGRWDAQHRTIGISGWLILEKAWHEVLETLKHEMAHQIVSELWLLTDMPHDSAAFRAACEKLRCDFHATTDSSRMIRLEDSPDPLDRIVSKIFKLLRLGASPNRHEATLAMERASALLARHNLDTLSLGREKRYFRRWIGPVVKRREEHHHALGVILNEHFFVRVIWETVFQPLTLDCGRQIAIIGTKENLDVAAYVHDFLCRTLEQLWLQHRESPEYGGGRKAQYQAGVTRGFLDKLNDQKQRLVKERALVWKSDRPLEEHVSHLYPRLRSSSSSGVARGADYHAGVTQGRELTLRMGVTERSGAGGGLLPPGSASDPD